MTAKTAKNVYFHQFQALTGQNERTKRGAVTPAAFALAFKLNRG
jgi:hypothetical protein